MVGVVSVVPVTMAIMSRGHLMATVAGDPMAEERERKTMPVRLGYEAIEAARIAGSLKGMSLAEYATTVLLDVANRDIDEYFKARSERALAKGMEAVKRYRASKSKGGGK
jgi:hypothetical protein